jgi:nucleotide-binding universal stress UspA family protein
MTPPRTVLAAIDFSESSRAALALAARLARHCGAALHVLHAEDPLLATAAGHAGLPLAEETDDELARFVASAWPAGECAPHRHVAVGQAVDVILDVAARERADILVVGSRGMSGAARLVFGSTTEHLLRRATLSVLVAPDGWEPARTNTPDLTGTGPVVAAVDFSPASIAAAAAACQMAAALGSPVEVVHVVPGLAVATRWRAQAESAIRERVGAAQKELANVARDLACAVPLTLRVETGAVPSCLADVAAPAAGRAPMLVLGRRSPESRAGAPGAIAYRVLSLAKVPVLMHVGTDA